MSPVPKLVLFLALAVHMTRADSFYSLSVIDSDGKTVSLEKYKGQVTLVVNVASECGFTDGHYKALVDAKNMLKSTGKFEILAFPCNQFNGQEPKDIKDILEFAQSNYGVNFPIFGKLDVHGDEAAEIYKYLKEKSGHSPTWNFWKYLVNHKGEVIGFWGPWSSVHEIFPSIRSAVEVAVAEEKAPSMPSTRVKPPPPPYTDEDMPRRQPVGGTSKVNTPSPAPPSTPIPPVRTTDRTKKQPSHTEARPPQPAPHTGTSPKRPVPSAPARRHEDL